MNLNGMYGDTISDDGDSDGDENHITGVSSRALFNITHVQ